MRKSMFVFFLCLLALTGCARNNQQKGITVAGSTSVQPFADKWAEVYMERYPQWIVNVQGGGSSAGIQAAKSGTCDIGTSSRELKPEEIDLNQIVVARDGLAVIVHPTNKVNNLSMAQLKGIFEGSIMNWKDVGGQDHPITVVTREEGSGTRGAFQDMVMKKTRICKWAIVEDSNGTVREIVSGDPNAIGYISLGLVTEKIKALDLDGIRATDDNIITKKYKLVRPFLFVCKGTPAGESKDFISFVLSKEGQQLVEKEGLIPAQ
jgi:phosphate transport system substrate-binding protein